MEFYTSAYKYGNNILVRGYNNGVPYNDKVKFKPTIYLKNNDGADYGWRTFSLTPESVCPFKYESIKDCENFVSQNKDIPNYEIYGQLNYQFQYLNENYPNDDMEFDISQMNICAIDIETATENGFPNILNPIEEILLITIKNINKNEIHTWGVGPYVNERPNVTYHQCVDEGALLVDFLNYWSQNHPDVITGWNTNFFDIPYLVNRIKLRLGDEWANKLSYWGVIQDNSINIGGKDQFKYRLYGIEQLDYLQLYKKHIYVKKESYKLDFIAEDELKENKLVNNYPTWKDFYTKDWQRFVDYNIHDVELIDKLDSKLSLIELQITMAYNAKTNFEDVFGQIKMWDSIVHNFLYKRNITIPQKQKHDKDAKFEGAYVKEPVPGMYNWVVSFDATSLYPSIMQTLNISKETYINTRTDVSPDIMLSSEVPIEENTCLSSSGAYFNRNKMGVFPEIIQIYMNRRVESKTKMIEVEKVIEDIKGGRSQESLEAYKKLKSTYYNRQIAFKTALNSLYGAMGNQVFRLFELEVARAVTLSGQLIIRKVSTELNVTLNNMFGTDNFEYVFYCDTDSVYITLDHVVKKYIEHKTKDPHEITEKLDKVCIEKLQPIIDSICDDIHRKFNAMQNKISFKREVIANKGIWTAKKRYILNVFNSEGVKYEEPKNKIMGLETARSSTPNAIRNKLKDAIKVIINGDEKELQNFIKEFKTEFYNLPIEQIAFPRGVNGMTTYRDAGSIFKKGTPINARASLLYNHLINKLNLNDNYELIKDEDKIKYIYLKEPNTLGENVIAFFDKIPPEFELEQFVDKEMQFNKTFLAPLSSIIETIGWSVKKKSTIFG